MMRWLSENLAGLVLLGMAMALPAPGALAQASAQAPTLAPRAAPELVIPLPPAPPALVVPAAA
ncbi:hypothetical protein, partial [Elioraea sp.]|uniref:hypothetical protein n=1 Tax=Elioraea sp. TaxID=2185103 RepID=UPI0025BA363D